MAKDDIIVRRRKLSDYTPDPNNANKGTVRGDDMLSTSIEQVGLARSITATADDVIPAGNGAWETAGALGIEDVIEVETRGKTLVVVKRTDWETIEDPSARRYAYFDNQTGSIRLDWDIEQILSDVTDGVDFSDIFYDWELQQFQFAPDDEEEYADQYQAMPEFEQEDQTSWKKLAVHFENEEDYHAFARLIGQELTEKTRSIWFPEHERDSVETEWVSQDED